MDIKFLRHSATLALSIVTLVFTFVPEASFGKIKLFSKISDEANITLNRVFAFALIFVFSVVAVLIFMTARRKVKIKGSNYAIIVEYGDLFKKSDAKIVIQFDECFTTTIGSNPSDINPSSVCGQYLENNPLQPQEMTALINKAQLIPAKSKSKFQKKDRYDSGKIVPNGRYLLLSFAKLDENGLGILSCDEFLDCLSTLWKEIDKYYGQEVSYLP